MDSIVHVSGQITIVPKPKPEFFGHLFGGGIPKIKPIILVEFPRRPKWWL